MSQSFITGSMILLPDFITLFRRWIPYFSSSSSQFGQSFSPHQCLCIRVHVVMQIKVLTDSLSSNLISESV